MEAPSLVDIYNLCKKIGQPAEFESKETPDIRTFREWTHSAGIYCPKVYS